MEITKEAMQQAYEQAAGGTDHPRTWISVKHGVPVLHVVQPSGAVKQYTQQWVELEEDL